MDAIRSPRVSDFLILCRQSPLVLEPRFHRLRGPGGSGDENGCAVHNMLPKFSQKKQILCVFQVNHVNSVLLSREQIAGTDQLE